MSDEPRAAGDPVDAFVGQSHQPMEPRTERAAARKFRA
jgi:hypothetical protein